MLATASCTQNNGHIGYLYGQWRLNDIKAELPDTVFTVDTLRMTWAFQTHVVCIQNPTPYHDRDDRWGSWSRTGADMELDFTYSDDMFAPGEGRYALPRSLYFPPSPCKVTLIVEKLEKSHMRLRYERGDSTLWYRFTKEY